MDLYEILASEVAAEGPEILLSPDLHHRQGVAEALYGFPAISTILAKAVASGSISRLLAGGLWGSESDRIIEKFVVHTGFQPALTRYVFSSVAKAAGIDVGKEQATPPRIAAPVTDTEKCAAEPQAAYGEPIADRYGVADGENPAWNALAGSAEKARFITSLIEIDTEKGDETGVTVKYPFCVKVDESTITLSLEISRTEPRATGALYIALYDMDSAIIIHGLAAALTLSSPSRLPVTLRLPCNPATLSRLRLYWL